MGLNNVATLGINVATFQRHIKINVATLISHVATFQRGLNSTSRRWELTSRRSRECKNQLHDAGNPRRDVPEKGKIYIATLRPNVATLQRKLHKNLHMKEPMSKKPSLLVNVTLLTCNAPHKRNLPSICVCKS